AAMQIERFATIALLGALMLGSACDRRTQTTPPSDDTKQDEVEAPTQRDEDADVTVLRGAKVMTAAGATYAPGAVVIVGDEIAAVGPVATIEVPEGARIVELSAEQVITPGIIDTHSHM